MYKTELHCHTNEVSACAKANSAETVKRYADAGYSSVVLTNHINPHTKYFADKDYKSGVEYYIEGYHIFCEAASGYVTPIFGAEVCLGTIGHNDYLIFGLTEEFLRDNPDIMEWKLDRLHDACRESNMLLVQAHPFRPGMFISDFHHLDGIEVFNGNMKAENHNDIADRWANYYKLIKTSGTDHHGLEKIISGGIMTPKPITTSAELVEILRGNGYGLLKCEAVGTTNPVGHKAIN